MSGQVVTNKTSCTCVQDARTEHIISQMCTPRKNTLSVKKAKKIVRIVSYFVKSSKFLSIKSIRCLTQSTLLKGSLGVLKQ